MNPSSTTPFKPAGIVWLLLAVILYTQPGNAQESYTAEFPQKQLRKEIRALHKKMFAMRLDTLADTLALYELVYTVRSGKASIAGEKPVKGVSRGRGSDTIPGGLIFTYHLPTPADTVAETRRKIPGTYFISGRAFQRMFLHSVRTKHDPLYQGARKHRQRQMLETPYERIFLSFGKEYVLMILITRYTGDLRSYVGVEYAYHRKIR